MGVGADEHVLEVVLCVQCLVLCAALSRGQGMLRAKQQQGTGCTICCPGPQHTGSSYMQVSSYLHASCSSTVIIPGPPTSDLEGSLVDPADDA